MNEFIRKFKLHKELTLLHAKKDVSDLSCLRFDNIIYILSSSLISVLLFAVWIGIIYENGILFILIAFNTIMLYIVILLYLYYCESAYNIAYLEVSQEYEKAQNKLNALDVNASEIWDSNRQLTLTLNDIEFISKMMIEFNKLNKV